MEVHNFEWWDDPMGMGSADLTPLLGVARPVAMINDRMAFLLMVVPHF
jgi:hypothetical protein